MPPATARSQPRQGERGRPSLEGADRESGTQVRWQLGLPSSQARSDTKTHHHAATAFSPGFRGRGPCLTEEDFHDVGPPIGLGLWVRRHFLPWGLGRQETC